jgi:hypothetical protein
MPIVGYAVVSLDRVILGRVVELGEGQFRVASSEGDWWLRKDAVFTVERETVTLVCNRDRVMRYKSGM